MFGSQPALDLLVLLAMDSKNGQKGHGKVKTLKALCKMSMQYFEKTRLVLESGNIGLSVTKLFLKSILNEAPY